MALSRRLPIQYSTKYVAYARCERRAGQRRNDASRYVFVLRNSIATMRAACVEYLHLDYMWRNGEPHASK